MKFEPWFMLSLLIPYVQNILGSKTIFTVLLELCTVVSLIVGDSSSTSSPEKTLARGTLYSSIDAKYISNQHILRLLPLATKAYIHQQFLISAAKPLHKTIASQKSLPGACLLIILTVCRRNQCTFAMFCEPFTYANCAVILVRRTMRQI